jgi:sulfate/thiosulfate transport system substrate-binding protein
MRTDSRSQPRSIGWRLLPHLWGLSILLAPTLLWAEHVKLINVSYDPTRELYEEINAAFIEHYRAQTGLRVQIEQSHGGSSKQARSVLEGVSADIVTLALGSDIIALERGGLVAAEWKRRLPHNASPYTSTIVFIVRRGNPKAIRDWRDLIRPDVRIVAANPKTSGAARWTFLAAWGAGGGVDATNHAVDEDAARQYVTQLYRQVPVLDTGARASSLTFAQKKIGDVLLAWESEAWLLIEEFEEQGFEIVYPSVSILTEPPVAVVDRVVDRRGTREVAEAYLRFLYSETAQEIIAFHQYRPRSEKALAQYRHQLPPLELFTLTDLARDWAEAQQRFFSDGGEFDRIYARDGQ